MWFLFRGYKIPGEGSWEPQFIATSSYVLEPCSMWKIALGCHICLIIWIRGVPAISQSNIEKDSMKPSRRSWCESICTKKSPRSTLEVYNKTSIFIPVAIKTDEVKLVTQILPVSLGPVGTESKLLQGWILKFGYNNKIFFTNVEIFANWLANQRLP